MKLRRAQNFEWEIIIIIIMVFAVVVIIIVTIKSIIKNVSNTISEDDLDNY